MSTREAGSNHPGAIAALIARYGARYRWLLLVSVMTGTMASIMSSTIEVAARQLPERPPPHHKGPQ